MILFYNILVHRLASSLSAASPSLSCSQSIMSKLSIQNKIAGLCHKRLFTAPAAAYSVQKIKTNIGYDFPTTEKENCTGAATELSVEQSRM